MRARYCTMHRQLHWFNIPRCTEKMRRENNTRRKFFDHLPFGIVLLPIIPFDMASLPVMLLFIAPFDICRFIIEAQL